MLIKKQIFLKFLLFYLLVDYTTDLADFKLIKL